MISEPRNLIALPCPVCLKLKLSIIVCFFSQELESENQLRQAEHHYVQAKDWKAAVNMYRNNESWDDAYRVCEIKLTVQNHRLQYCPFLIYTNLPHLLAMAG